MARFPKTSGIYRIDIGPSSYYFGSGVDLQRRRRQHLLKLTSDIHENPRMTSAWKKHNDFQFSIVEICEPEILLDREQSYLDAHFGTAGCMNILPTAHSWLGMKHSDESKAKMSAWRKGRPMSMEARQHMSEAGKGRQFSPEHRSNLTEANHRRWANQTDRTVSPATRAKISAAHKGRVFSEEHRRKLSEANRRRSPISEETRQRMSVAAKARAARRSALSLPRSD